MDVIQYSIKKPVTVAVAVILIVMFGIIGLRGLPVQLTPDVEKPQITVQTRWNGASPNDIEKDIIEKQEEVFKGLKGLTKMESQSYNSLGQVTLTFSMETILEDAILRVSNKLDEVKDYPDNVDKPIIDSGGRNSPVIWMMLKSKDEAKNSVNHYRTFFEDEIRQYLDRIPGVGSLLIFGGTEDELHIVADAEKMSMHKVSFNGIINAVRNANKDTSAGVLGIEKKNYRIRTTGAFQSVQDAENTVIFDDGVTRVYLKDVADVYKGYQKSETYIANNNQNGIVVGVRKEKGANVLDLTNAMEERVKSLNETTLAEKGVYLDWMYDERPYIGNAINLVKKNIAIGATLAIIVLFVFLRSVTSTITTGVAIPISAIGTFIFMWAMGRNLNIVSLAGISFAVGMLVDNAIVVLENIDRHRRMGKKAFNAAFDGAQEVWGAVLASTMTTVAVFLPIIFMRDEAGQLFRDIAIAITFSILLSLFVSVSVIPTLINQFYKRAKQKEKKENKLGGFFVGWIMKLSDLFMKNTVTRLVTIFAFTAFSLTTAAVLMPPAEYLPQGNRNLILNILVPPPGYSQEKMKKMGDDLYKEIKPYMEQDGKDGIPQINHIFYVGAERFNILGGISKHETRAGETIPMYRKAMATLPGVFGVSIQAGIFQSELGAGRNIDVNINGDNITDIINSARVLYGVISQNIKGAQVRPIPSIEDSYPEVRIIPDRNKLAANGMNTTDLGTYVDILMDGRKIDEYGPEGKKNIDVVVKGDDKIYKTPEEIVNAIIVNGNSDLIRIKDVSNIVYTQGMPQINHLERRRNITLQVTPPAEIPLQAAMEMIQNKIVPGLEKAGKLKGVKINLGGNADKLATTMESLKWNIILAVIITYLLMSALFENFLYPFIILFSVPLAFAGAFIGLELVNTFVAPQGFDVLAMLGFIILIGTVVNNAILIVHQSLNNIRYEGMEGVEAIKDSVRTRIRPIFMSATTSLLAMFPLTISTGPGSELYRGLGAIILGGLGLSTIFTLFVIPALLSFFVKFERSRTDETA